MSRVGKLTGWTLGAALTVLCWRGAGTGQFMLLVLSSLIGLWLAATIAVCAAAQHRRSAANTHLSQRHHPSSNGGAATHHLRR